MPNHYKYRRLSSACDARCNPISLLLQLEDEFLCLPLPAGCIANLLDSPGGLKFFPGPAKPRTIIAAARAAGVGVMGIRAVQAGALTTAIDRTLSANYPDQKDYDRAAPFRALCASWGEDPAVVAHRYALGIEGVDTVVLGVKNRAELQQCLDAEAASPLEPAQVAAIDALDLVQVGEKN